VLGTVHQGFQPYQAGFSEHSLMVYLYDSPVIALHRCANVKHSPVFVKVAQLLSKLAQLFN
jgi:hypothetical protein